MCLCVDVGVVCLLCVAVVVASWCCVWVLVLVVSMLVCALCLVYCVWRVWACDVVLGELVVVCVGLVRSVCDVVSSA